MWDKLQILYTKDNIFDWKEAKLVKDLKKGSSNCKDLKDAFVSVKILEESQDKEEGSLSYKVCLAIETKEDISKNEDKEHEEYEDKEGEVYLEEELICALNEIKELKNKNTLLEEKLNGSEGEIHIKSTKIDEKTIIGLKAQIEKTRQFLVCQLEENEQIFKE